MTPRSCAITCRIVPMVFLSFLFSKKNPSPLLHIQAAHAEVDGELGERDQRNERENGPLVTVKQLSLRNNRLKFKSSGKIQVILEESIEYTLN